MGRSSSRPDNGCKYSPSCLTCPLEDCRYVDPIVAHAKRNGEIQKKRKLGWKTRKLAEHYSLSPRAVRKICSSNPTEGGTV